MAQSGEANKAGRPMKWPRIRERVVNGRTYYLVDAGAYGLTDEQKKKGRRRNRKTFSTLADANAHAVTLRAKRKADTTAAKFEASNRAVRLANLTDGQRSDVLAAFKLLADTKGTLSGAVAFWKAHAAPANARTCAEVLADLTAACERANRRPRTVAEIEAKVGEFCADYGTEPIARVTAADVSGWLDKRTAKLSPRSRAAYRQSLNRLFAFAVKRGLREANPVHTIEKPSIETAAPEVFTVAEARTLLQAAAAFDAKQRAEWATAAERRAKAGKEPPAPPVTMLPYYAVGLFAGLRTENELVGLDWRLVDLSGRTITVSAASAKKRRARVVDISDNLAEWLAPYRQDAGPLCYSRRAHREIVKAAKIDWPRNVMRHSFGSYHLAAHNDAGKTAMQLGHPHGVEVLFNHYRTMVKAAEANDYWQIRPEGAGKVIQLNAATA